MLTQIGVLKLEDDEFEILLEIFEKLNPEILLTSSYIAIKYEYCNIVIPESVIAELERIEKQKETSSEEKNVILKILNFRQNAPITI